MGAVGAGQADELKRRLVAYRGDPRAFCRDVFGSTLDPWQEKACELVRDERKVAIAGCTGSGKDHVAAHLVWWFLLTHPYCKIICTAVKEDTLRDNLFAELSLLMRRSPLIEQLVDFRATKIAVKGAEAEWFVVARTASRRSSTDGSGVHAEGLAGKYSKYVLNVIDEASGVDDAIFDALEGSANTNDRKILAIGNPLRRVGRFAQFFLDERFRSDWATLNVSYLDSSQTNGPDERRIREKWIEQYGRESAFVQARVFGQFPKKSTDDTVFTAEEVRLARRRVVKDDAKGIVTIGIDVARYGLDETVYYVRRGGCSLEMVCESQTSSVDIVRRAKLLARKWAGYDGCSEGDIVRLTRFVVDETGVGSGVIDPLADEGWNVFGVHNGSRSRHPEEYYNLGAQLWLLDAKLAMQTCSLMDDDLLAQQLETRQYRFTGTGKQRRLAGKDEMRKRGLSSPDRADAFSLAFASDETIGLAAMDLSKTIAFV